VGVHYQVGMLSLYVAQAQEAKRFYVDVLGWQQVPQFSSDTFILLAPQQGASAALWQIGDDERAMGIHAGQTVVGVEVDDVDGAWRELTEAGSSVLGKPADMGAGRHFFVRDADGRLLDVYELYAAMKQG
jgi:predicted enzyme related to lactoylglutathione lyase